MRTIILLLLIFSEAAYSCDSLLEQNFKPLMVNSYFNPKKQPENPIAIIKVERAKSFTPSCRQPSFLKIEIENSAENHNAGYIFKVKGAPIKGIAFPEEPIISNSAKYFYFTWLESEAELKLPVEATIEIVAILPNGKKSESTYINLSQSNH
jgi:hypothetical protein